MKKTCLFLLLLQFVSCSSQNFDTPVSLSQSELQDVITPWDNHQLRALGIKIELPRTARVSWSSCLVTIWMHPLVENPVASTQYKITIEGVIRKATELRQSSPKSSNSDNIREWQNTFHLILSRRSDESHTYLRKDLPVGTEDVLSIKAVVRQSNTHEKDILSAERIIKSIKPNRLDD